MLFLQYVKNNSEKVTLEAIECPEQDFDTDMTVLKKDCSTSGMSLV